MKKVIIVWLISLSILGVFCAYAGNLQITNSSSLTNSSDAASPGEMTGYSSATPAAANPIRIVVPSENAKLPAIASTFVCGWVPAGGKLSINGIPVTVHPGGGFLTMVQLSPGIFPINAEFQLGNTVYNLTRTIIVAEPAKPAPASPLTIEYVTPRQDQEVLPGDCVEVVCKGSPGGNAYFTLNGVRKKFPMIESEGSPGGIYRGVYRVGVKDGLKKSKIKLILENVKKRKTSKESDGIISLFPGDLPVMAETITADAVLRAGPALSTGERAGYWIFPPIGTLLQITGRNGDEYRVRLTKTEAAWVNTNQVKLLPPGTLPARVVAGNISISADDASTKVRLSVDRKIPFKVEPDAGGEYIDILFYGAYSNTDWVTNAASGIVKHISWFQDDEETYRIRVFTIPNSWWGYDPRYEGNSFVLELRKPPALIPGNSSLTGLTIAVDPGHSPDSGAIGATGYAEREANLALALNLKEKLTARGAKVVMTRNGSEGVPLLERPRIAWQNKADILLSIHNNSLGYGGNPFIKRGFGVYYFTPMSLPLAKEIHTAYRETFINNSEFNLPDDGFYYSNFALTRSPQMPSVLIESAYMIVPEEEAYLKTDSFRSACSNAIIRGLERYAHSMRPEAPKTK